MCMHHRSPFTGNIFEYPVSNEIVFSLKVDVCGMTLALITGLDILFVSFFFTNIRRFSKVYLESV